MRSSVGAEPETDGSWRVTMAVPIEAVRQALAGPRALAGGGRQRDPPVVIVDGVTRQARRRRRSPAATIWVTELPAWAKDAPHVTGKRGKGGAIAGIRSQPQALYVIVGKPEPAAAIAFAQRIGPWRFPSGARLPGVIRSVLVAVMLAALARPRSPKTSSRTRPRAMRRDRRRDPRVAALDDAFAHAVTRARSPMSSRPTSAPRARPTSIARSSGTRGCGS